MRTGTGPVALFGYASIALFVGAFGPAELRACQDAMIEANLSRTTVNARTRKLRRAFKWGVARSMVEPSVLHALQAVEAVRAGRKGVRDDHRDTSPIDDATLERTVAELSPTVAAMVRVQRLTGMRPGEICILRPRDLDREQPVWLYQPESHKTEHHGKWRVIPVGPKAQEILTPYLDREEDREGCVPEDREGPPADESHPPQRGQGREEGVGLGLVVEGHAGDQMQTLVGEGEVCACACFDERDMHRCALLQQHADHGAAQCAGSSGDDHGAILEGLCHRRRVSPASALVCSL